MSPTSITVESRPLYAFALFVRPDLIADLSSNWVLGAVPIVQQSMEIYVLMTIAGRSGCFNCGAKNEDAMQLAVTFLVLFLVVTSTACGNSSPRMLQSVVATPAKADAQDFPDGKVQFTPTGIFNQAPTRVTPLPTCSAAGTVGACITGWSTFPPTVAAIDQNGLAQCVPGQSQTAKIEIALSGDGPLIAVATLTCP